MTDGEREVTQEIERDARETEEGLARAEPDIFDDAQYVHPLVDRLRERANRLRIIAVHGPEVGLMNRAADVIEELHRQNVVLRRTCGMEPLPPVE